MSRNLALAEAQLPYPEDVRPSLELVQDGSEVVERTDDFTKPDLYVVAEAEDTVVDNPDGTAAEPEASSGEEDTAVNMLARSTRAAATVEYTVPASKSYHEEDAYKHKGGGGWYLRELIRKAIAKLEAKSHASDCDCEFHDGH